MYESKSIDATSLQQPAFFFHFSVIYAWKLMDISYIALLSNQINLCVYPHTIVSRISTLDSYHVFLLPSLVSPFRFRGYVFLFPFTDPRHWREARLGDFLQDSCAVWKMGGDQVIDCLAEGMMWPSRRKSYTSQHWGYTYLLNKSYWINSSYREIFNIFVQQKRKRSSNELIN